MKRTKNAEYLNDTVVDFKWYKSLPVDEREAYYNKKIKELTEKYVGRHIRDSDGEVVEISEIMSLVFHHKELRFTFYFEEGRTHAPAKDYIEKGHFKLID